MRIETARFSVEQVIGSGSMGTVFRAIDQHTGAAVALKVLRGPGPAARFAREADILARLAHPGIVRYVGHGTTEHGEPFLAMAWLDGETLHARLRGRGLRLAESLALARRLADALAAAHDAGVVHRDVKPSNIMLVGGRADAAVLVDFGIARADAAHGTLTGTGALVGTPSYMAPEQALQARQVSPAADVYSLGCVLHECVVGSAPVIAPQTSGAIAAIPAAVLRPALPAAVSHVLARMLAAQPAHRPLDGAAIAAELAALVAAGLPDLPPPARPHAFPASPGAAAGAVTSFAQLHALATRAPLSAAAAQLVEVLGRHVPMPAAVLRSQCELRALDPQQLTRADIAALSADLADAVARFTAPGRRALVLAELHALVEEPAARS